MFRRKRYLGTLLLGASLVAPMLLSGCAARVRYYDAYYGDYHPWNNHEAGEYRVWLSTRHYDYRDYDRLSHDQQRDYWQWRHEHHDKDRDRDRH